MTPTIGARYRSRHPEIEAVRLTAETFHELVATIPGPWLARAHEGDSIDPMHLRIRVRPFASLSQRAAVGDWIVRDEAGEWRAYHADEFAGRFQAVGVPGETEETERGSSSESVESSEAIYFFTVAFAAEADSDAFGQLVLREGLQSLGRPRAEPGPAGTFVVNTADRTVRINWQAATREQAVAEAIAYVEARTGHPATLGTDPDWDRIEPQPVDARDRQR